MKKIISIVVILTLFIMFNANLYAFSLNNIVTSANSFKNAHASGSGGLGNILGTNLTNDLLPVVRTIGYLVIAASTVILGAKYIWSASEGKAAVKNTLPTFIIGIIFFYLGERIVTAISGELGTVTDYNTMAGKILGTINNIVRYVAFAGIIFLGIKYMFESGSGKADIKEHAVPLVLGIILVFCATTFVQFIINAGVELFP